MSLSLAEIESNLFESLKSSSCPPLKNVLNIEANKTIKDILCDSVYLEEKLNLYIWLMCSYEPRLASEFQDAEFYSTEVKCKKVIEGLSVLGLVDLCEFTPEKFLNSKFYKEILLILNDLNDLFHNKTHSHTTHNHDIFDLDLIAVDTHTNDGNYLSEILSKRIQMLDDANFYREYRSVLQHLSTSVVPSDMQRIIKVVNENSTYSISFDKNLKREELIELISQEISSVDDQIEKINQNLNQFDLVSIDEGKKEAKLNSINDFKSELVEAITHIKEFNSFVDSLTRKSNENESSKPTGVESNFGKSFFDFQSAYNQFLKFKNTLIEWSNILKFHSERLAEFKASNLVEPVFYEATINCNQNLKQCSELLGHNMSSIPSNSKLNLDANSTAVDELLML